MPGGTGARSVRCRAVRADRSSSEAPGDLGRRPVGAGVAGLDAGAEVGAEQRVEVGELVDRAPEQLGDARPHSVVDEHSSQLGAEDPAGLDRKSVAEGQSVSVRVDSGGCLTTKKTKK